MLSTSGTRLRNPFERNYSGTDGTLSTSGTRLLYRWNTFYFKNKIIIIIIIIIIIMMMMIIILLLFIWSIKF